jgi:transcriptional regulator with XRE-family HTH domain
MPAPRYKPAFPELAAELARTGTSNIELAERAGCSVGSITHIIRGRMNPSDAMRERIAAALQWQHEVDALFRLSDDHSRLLAAAKAAVDEAPPLPEQVVRALVCRKGGAKDAA